MMRGGVGTRKAYSLLLARLKERLVSERATSSVVVIMAAGMLQREWRGDGGGSEVAGAVGGKRLDKARGGSEEVACQAATLAASGSDFAQGGSHSGLGCGWERVLGGARRILQGWRRMRSLTRVADSVEVEGSART